MVRLFLIAAVLFVAWRLLTGRALWPRRTKAAETAGTDTVRCRQCGVFLPAHQAITQDGNTYCSPAHRDAACH